MTRWVQSVIYGIILLLLLSRFSRVRLCATPQMAAHQTPPSLGFTGKNTGVGYHFPLQCMKVKSESEVAQLCPTLSDPMDCNPPGSSIHGIFQARVLKWGATAFSDGIVQEVANFNTGCGGKQEWSNRWIVYKGLKRGGTFEK